MLVLAGSVLLVFVLALTGTATPESTSEAASLPPVVWELVELPGSDGVPVEIAVPERYTIQFLPDGKVAIKADCNRAGGGVTVEDGSVEFALLAATLALCPPDSQAEPFMAQLTGTMDFSFDDEGALILAGEQGAMRLRPSLAGVVWEWREFQGMDDSTVSPDDPSHYTIEFLPEGRIAVRADCNGGFGTYTTDGPMMTLDVIGLTRAMCPPGSLADRFVEDAGMVSSHVFRDGMLYLALPVDAGILAFDARYVAPEPATPAAG